MAAAAATHDVVAPAETELVGRNVVEHVGTAVSIVSFCPLTHPVYDGVGVATEASPYVAVSLEAVTLMFFRPIVMLPVRYWKK